MNINVFKMMDVLRFMKSGNRRKNYNKIQSPGKLFYIIDNGHEYKPEVF